MMCALPAVFLVPIAAQLHYRKMSYKYVIRKVMEEYNIPYEKVNKALNECSH